MPHKCVRCGKAFPDASQELIKGCECGSRIFLYLRNGQPAPAVEGEDLKWLEEELLELSREKPVSIEPDAVENIRMLGQGTYELNVGAIMKGEPIVIKAHNGVYFIKMPAAKTGQKA
ncbi:MAG: Zn-ribbon containing protein [Candidatus Micrarchaeota archaeon]